MSDYMIFLGLLGGGFVLGTYFGVSLMALMTIARRSDVMEVELERRGGFKCMDISIPNQAVQ